MSSRLDALLDGLGIKPMPVYRRRAAAQKLVEVVAGAANRAYPCRACVGCVF